MRVDTRQPSGQLVKYFVWLATTSLSLGGVLPALAQPAAPPGAELAGQENTDPPPVAGSLAAISGTVSFHAAGETNWSAASLNYPVTNGEGFWTEPSASATIDIADDKVVMDESTEFDVTTLDQGQFVSTLAQGAVFLQLNSLAQGQALTVNTPRGAVTISQAGRYEIVAGDTNDATLVSVIDGAAHVSATGMDLDVGPQQTATIGGADNFQGDVGALQQDSFLQAQLRLVVKPQVAASVPREVQYMTGGAELASYGSFTQTQAYGQVWYPRDVPSNWAPYRDGHWAYVQPWGWTWVDNARWGFAPFHYGRWVQVNDRWGWVAGGGEPVAVGAYPVYSPALVSFVGVGAGVSVGITIGAGEYAPAWIPLGPREPYYPWYHCRADYFARMNRPYGVPQAIIARGPTYINNVHNTTVINNTTINQTFINQRAATVIPAAAFARGTPVMQAGRPLPPQAFANARPLVGRLPVTPTAFTPNLPPAAARRFNVPVPARPVQAVTAGPRIVVAMAPGAHAAPELRRTALPQNIHAVPAAQVHAGPPSPAGARPGLPAARPNGAVPVPQAPGGQPQHPLPQLRGPGGRPETASPRPGLPEAGRPNVPAPHEPNAPARPGEAPHPVPGHAAPEARPGAIPHPAEPHAPAAPAAPHAAEPHVAPPAANRPAPHVEARPAAPRPAEHDTAPHAEVPHLTPAPHAETPHPTPRAEAPRPQLQPHAETPHPSPAPHAEVAHPTPHAEAPRPQPQPRAEPAHPAPAHAEAPHAPARPEPHAPQKRDNPPQK